jgi:hypothetical protein
MTIANKAATPTANKLAIPSTFFSWGILTLTKVIARGLRVDGVEAHGAALRSVTEPCSSQIKMFGRVCVTELGNMVLKNPMISVLRVTFALRRTSS